MHLNTIYANQMTQMNPAMFGGGGLTGQNSMMAMMAQMLQMMMSMMAMMQGGQGGGAMSPFQNPSFGRGQNGFGMPGQMPGQFGSRGPMGNFLGGGGGNQGNVFNPGNMGAGPGPRGPVPGAEQDSAQVGVRTGDLVDLGGGKRVDSSIAGNVKRMIADAKQQGVDLKITSAFRSRQQQEVLYAKYKNGTGNLAARPGTSNHESGRAIDFSNTPGAYAWLKNNAGRYGLKNLPGEPWHYSTNGR